MRCFFAQADYATVEALGEVECSAGYNATGDVAPSVVCEWDGELPVAEFVFSGCEQIACVAPEEGTLTDDPADETRALSRYVIVGSATEAADLEVGCAPEFVGTASAICLELGGDFEYSGCEWRVCAAPSDGVTGYAIDNLDGTTGDQFETGVNFQCAQDYVGHPEVEGCTVDGGDFTFTGCDVLPEKTSGARVPGASGRGLVAALLAAVAVAAPRATLL